MDNKVIIKLEVENDCRKCPFCNCERTIDAGYAFDYHCTKTEDNRMIMGYVEYMNDIKPIPDWCPFR